MVFKNKELTAVDWLELIYNSGNLNPKSFREAKKIMEKQIVEAFNEGALDGLQLGKQYYEYKYIVNLPNEQ